MSEEHAPRPSPREHKAPAKTEAAHAHSPAVHHAFSGVSHSTRMDFSASHSRSGFSMNFSFSSSHSIHSSHGGMQAEQHSHPTRHNSSAEPIEGRPSPRSQTAPSTTNDAHSHLNDHGEGSHLHGPGGPRTHMSMHFSFGGMSMSFSMQSSSHLDPQEHHHMPATPHIPYGASAQERLSTGRSALAALMSPPVPEKEILQIEDRPQPKATAAKPVSVRPLKVEEID